MRDFTIGVEEEYQLVDPETGELQSRARAVLAGDWSGELKAEMQESTVEIGTRVCEAAAGVERELVRLRLQAAAAAAAEEVEIVAAGVHPFSPWRGQAQTAGERYRQILDTYGRIAKDEHNFGMHIHVAPPPLLDRIRLLNRVRPFSPHLLALACSSPFYEGDDTDYASFRMVLWRRWPNSGMPPRLGSEAEFERLVGLMVRTGAIRDPRNLYWSIRPHPVYPTLEFRMTDVCPRLEDAVSIAALARALVAAAAEGQLEDRVWSRLSADAEQVLLSGNEWRASRYGMDAVLVDPTVESGASTLRDAVLRVVERVSPVAERLGDGGALARLEHILERGNGADRMRRTYRELREFPSLVRWLALETLHGTGVDRGRAWRLDRVERKAA